MTTSNQPNNSQANQEAKPKTQNSSPPYYNAKIKRYLPTVIVVVTIVSCAFLVYKYINAYQQMLKLTTKNACLQQQITAINTRLNKFNKTTEKIQDNYKLQQENHNVITHVVSSLKDNLSQIQNTDRTKWLVFETEILVNLANQYLQTLKDKQQCLAVLHQADELLKRSNQNLTFYIRNKLNKAIAKLQTIEYVNADEILLKLSFIATLVEDISIPATINYNKVGELEATATATTAIAEKITVTDFILEKLNLLWLHLKQLFIISKRDLTTVYPLPQQQEISTIKLIIFANIEQARIALLTKQQQTFTNSINKISLYLTYLPIANSENLRNQLKLLATTDFSLPITDILAETLYSLAQFNSDTNNSSNNSPTTEDKPIKTEEDH